MKKRSATLLTMMALIAGLFAPAALAHEGSHEVEIRDMGFQPETLTIDAGETVTWTAREDGHNVVSDTGAWSPSATLRSGESFAVPFPNEGTFRYKCSRHLMRGTIKVGDGCDGECPVPEPDAPAEIRVVPSLDFPDLASGLDAAPARTLVELRPGSYEVSETLELTAPGLVLRGVNEDGTPADPSSVVLRGIGGTEIGVRIGAAATSSSDAPASLENLTVTRFLDTGVVVEAMRGFRISNVRAVQNVEFGIRALRSSAGTIVDSFASGHRRAGLSIESCDSCDVRVRRLRSENNFVGIQGRNAGSLVVQGSAIGDNGAGVVLRSVATEPPHLQRGNHFYGNTITNNDNIDAPRPPLWAIDEALELGSGAGIWIQGGWDDVVENNLVANNHYGIVVTASTAPVKDATVIGNSVSSNLVDLGTDGVGAGVCFSGNSPNTTEPAAIETLYGCSRRVRTGVPYPKVTADLAVYAWRSYYCAEVDPRLCI